MPPFAYFVAKVLVSMGFSAVVVLLLRILLGVSFGGVRMPLGELSALVATLLVGSIPFSAMGLALGYFAGPNSAPTLINLIYLPMSFCSGLWVPYMFLPKFMQHVALALPPITWHNWRWEMWARDSTSQPQPTGRFYSPSL